MRLFHLNVFHANWFHVKAVFLAFVMLAFSPAVVFADEVNDAVHELQLQWAVANYKTAVDEKKRYSRPWSIKRHR